MNVNPTAKADNMRLNLFGLVLIPVIVAAVYAIGLDALARILPQLQTVTHYLAR